MATDALRYWESRRLVYNGVLGLIVVCYFVAGWPASRTTLSLDSVLHLFLLAVMANVFYCAAYLVDGFVQLSSFRQRWSSLRWVLFALGTAFAAVITRFFTIGFLRFGL